MDALGGVYTKIEDVFYGALDFLDEKGIPVYSVVDPLEEHGIPALPLTVFLALVFGFLLFGVVLAPQVQTQVTFSLLDAASLEPVRNATIEVKKKNGTVLELESTSVSSGQKVFLPGVGAGEELTFTARRQGYSEQSVTTKISKGENQVIISLEPDLEIIDGLVQLVDLKTNDPVSDAQVIATLGDNSTVVCSYSSSQKAFSCPGLVEGADARVTIKSSNFEEINLPTKFYTDAVQKISLEPKAGASTGISNFIIRVYDAETKQLVPGAVVKIFDAVDDGLISEFVDDDGELLTRIEKGTSIRVSISAEGYVRYDSAEQGIEKTLRADEEILEAQLLLGGATVSIGVTDLSGLAQSSAVVQLFDESNNLVDSKETSLGGEVFFDDLDVQKQFTATAYKDGFLQARKTFTPSAGTEIDLVLEQASTANSSRVEIFVTEPGGTGSNGATVNLFELLEEKEIPLGVPQGKTDINGRLAFYAKNGTVIIARAFKEGLEGEGELRVQSNQNNDLLIEMFQTKGIVTLHLVDALGSAVTQGHVKIETKQGDTLEELDLESLDENEEVIFDALENDFVMVKFTDLEGKTFSEEVNVKDKTDVTVVIRATSGAEGLYPTITFREITTVSGEKVDGLTKGDFFYLVFDAVFPEGAQTSGFHVRVGNDTVKHADSDEVGVTGFLSDSLGHFYGRTFSMLPEPGAEGIDFQNEGAPGAFNKFLEIYFDTGGTKTIKVKVTAKETTTKTGFDLHYRAWSKFGEDYYRAPKDESLGTQLFSAQKSGLYANSNLETIRVFEATFGCKTTLCVSYKFIEDNGAEHEAKDFKAVKDKVYSLAVEISPTTDADATLKVSTSKTAPKVFFQGYAVEDASIFPDNNKLDTTLEVNGILVPSGKSAKILAFFKTVDIGSVSFTVQTITGQDVVTDSLFFEIFEEKELVVTTNPQNVVFGENFSFEVSEADAGPVENAMIILSDTDNHHLETIVGNGSTDKGLDGLYLVKNSFDTGIIKYEASAAGFRPKKGEISVYQKEVLSLPQEIAVTIPKNPPSTVKKISLLNNSNELVQDVVIEVKRSTGFPQGMNVRATSLGLVEPNGAQDITITADYSGPEQRARATATLIARGRLSGKFLVEAQSKLVIDFNPVLPQDCIEFSKGKLVVFVESGYDTRNQYDDIYEKQFYNQGINAYDYAQVPQNNDFGLTDELGRTVSRTITPYNRYFGYTDTKQLELVVRNKCDSEIELFPQAVPRAISDTEGLNIQINSVKLKPAGTVESGRRLDEQKVTIAVTNSMLRNYPRSRVFAFDILFNSDSLTKAIPLDVIIWNPRFALEFVRNVELWLAQENPNQPARAVAPLFVRNIGQAPIENLTFRASSRTTGGNVDLKIVPSTPIQFLYPGQSINPPKTIIAEALRTEKSTPYDVKELSISGLIDGRLYEFGPIYVTSHVSGFECLKVIPNSIDFSSEKAIGILVKKARVKNTCTEQIRLTGISPNQFGSNVLSATLEGITLLPGQDKEIDIILSKKESWQAQTPVYVDAVLVRSGSFIRSNPINIDLKIGEKAFEQKLAFEEKEIPVCFSESTKKVRFPKIALNNNCQTAYCDADQLANFLAQKAGEKIQSAKREIANYKSEILNTSCSSAELSQGFCSFDSLNVKPETFTVFFSNDSLTPELMKSAAQKNAKEIAGFKYDYLIGPGVGPDMGQIGNRVFLSHSISECGKYVVEIEGAVKVIGSKIDADIIDVLVNLTPENALDEEEQISELTDQCLPKIQNTANFLPQDKAFGTVEEALGAWPGVVEAKKTELADTARDLAEKMFGQKTRGEKTSAGTNKLALDFGVETGYLAKVSMQKTDETGPRTINAFVQEVGGTQSALRTEILREAVDAIAGLKNNSVDGCISENEEFFLLKSAGTVRGLELELGACIDQATKQPDKLSVLAGSQTCCTLAVSSQIKEKAKIQPVYIDKAGITDPVIQKNGQVTEEVELSESTQKTTTQNNPSPSQTQQNNQTQNPPQNNQTAQTGQTNNATGQVVLAELQQSPPQTPPANGQQPPSGAPQQPPQNQPGTGTATPPGQNTGQQPGTGQTPPPAPQTTPPVQPRPPVAQQTTPTKPGTPAKNFKAEAELCVQGLSDAQAANNKEIEVTAFASDNPERKAEKTVRLQFCGLHPDDIAETIFALKEPGEYYLTPTWTGDDKPFSLRDAQDIAANAAFADNADKTVQSQNLGSQTPFEQKQKQNKLYGLGIYFGACGVAAGIWGGMKFGFGAVTDIIWDCAIPAASAAADLLDSTQKAKEWIKDVIKDIPVLGWVAEKLGSAGENIAQALEGDQKNAESQVPTLTTSALTSVSAYTLYHGISDATSIIGPASARAAAAQISNQLCNEMSKSAFGGVQLGVTISRLGGLAYPRGDIASFLNACRTAHRQQLEFSLRKYYGKNFYSPVGESGTTLSSAIAEARVAAAKDKALLEEFAKVTDKIVNRTTKETLKKAKEEAAKNVLNREEIFGEIIGLDDSTTISPTSGNPTVPNAGELNKFKNIKIKEVVDSTFPKIEGQLEKNIGKDTLNSIPATPKGNKKTLLEQIKDRYKQKIKSSISIKTTPIKDVTRANVIITGHTAEISEGAIKKAVKIGADDVVSLAKSGAVKDAVEKVATKEIAEKFVSELGQNAEQFIVKDGGKFKIKWTQFRSFLRNIFKKTFWKDMLKGGLGGVISNAVGLFAYNEFMEKYGQPDGPDLKIERPLGEQTVQPSTQFQKNKTYKVTISPDGRRFIDPAPVDMKNVPQGAKWLNKCDSSALAGFQGVENLQPKPEVFKKAGLLESIPATVKYYKAGIGRMLKGLGELDFEAKYGAPEALVVTAGIMKSKLGTDSENWLTGCNEGKFETKEAAASLDCAAKDLGVFYGKDCASAGQGAAGDEALKQRAICALKKYNEKHTISGSVDYEKAGQTFLAWNSMKRIV